jgi:hypothetical protein
MDEVDTFVNELAIAAARGALGDELESEDEEEGRCEICSNTGWDHDADSYCTACTVTV